MPAVRRGQSLPLELSRFTSTQPTTEIEVESMSRTSILLTAVCLTFLTLSSRALAQSAPLHSGGWLIGGSASLTRDRNSQQEETTTHAGLNPTGLVFLNSHLALGGELALGYDGLGNGGHAVTYGIGPAARFYPMTTTAWLPFLAVTAAREWQRITLDGFPSSHASLVSIDGSLGVTRVLATHVGLDGAFFYRHSRITNQFPASPANWTQDDYGLRFGLSVFVH